MAAAVNCSKDTRRGFWMKTVSRLKVMRAIFGSKAKVRRWVTGSVRKKLIGRLSMAGLELEISISVTSMVTGFTWDAVTIVLSRVGNGYRPLKLKEHYFVTPKFGRLRW